MVDSEPCAAFSLGDPVFFSDIHAHSPGFSSYEFVWTLWGFKITVDLHFHISHSPQMLLIQPDSHPCKLHRRFLITLDLPFQIFHLLQKENTTLKELLVVQDGKALSNAEMAAVDRLAAENGRLQGEMSLLAEQSERLLTCFRNCM